jgi:RNA polymerase sigma-70 factor, ECF subfamily
MSGPQHLDDLVQDSFVRIWKGINRFDNKSQLKTWIYRIVINTCIDHFRKNKNIQNESLLKEDVPVRDLSMCNLDNRDLVQKGLAELSLEHRTVLVLHCMEELTINEVAEISNVPAGTVKSRIFHAKKAMLVFLKKMGVTL